MSSFSPPPSATSKVSQRIKQWLVEENDNWKFNVVENPSLYLNLQAIANDRSIHITLDGIHDRIVLVTSMSFTKEQKNTFSLKPLAERNQFISDLLIALHQLDLLAHVPKSSHAKTEYILQKTIYFDSLSKDKLFNSLYTILRGMDTIQQFINKLHFASYNDESLK